MSKTQKISAYLFVFFSAVLLYALFRPDAPQILFYNSDKVGHLLIFFAVALSGRLATMSWQHWWYWPLLAGLAIVLEYLQGALWATRVFSMEDAWANLAGVVVAMFLWLVSRRAIQEAQRHRGYSNR